MIGRRTLLAAAAGLAPRIAHGADPASGGSRGADPAPGAKAEGLVTFYTSIEPRLAFRIGQAFEARFPALRVRAEVSGAEPIDEMLLRDYGRNVRVADVVDSSDVTSFVEWKRRRWLAAFVPDDVAKFWPEDERDPDGMFATLRAHFAVMGYNTQIVQQADRPRRYVDLAGEKWRGQLVNANPSYSGAAVTAIYEIVQQLGWDYLEQLAHQNVLQVASSNEPPAVVGRGERAGMVCGSEYAGFALREAGAPIEIVYPEEGTPLVCAQAAVLATAPNPEGARHFANFLFSAECQQLMSDVGGTRSFHPAVRPRAGRLPMSQIKMLRPEPMQLAKSADEIKRRCKALFGA